MKTFRYIGMALAAIALSFNLAACGGDDETEPTPSGDGGGSTTATHEYVNLGLPSGTMWATTNIGADKPEDYGDYFAWGETTGHNAGKKEFCRETYKYLSEYMLTKYCLDEEQGDVDGKTTLDLADDAAYVNWGSDWRMPTRDQMQELIDKCSWEWEGMGYRVTGPSGKSIFLPAAGRYLNSSLSNSTTQGYYLTTGLFAHDSYSVYTLKITSEEENIVYGYRYNGQSIRPVRAIATPQPDAKVSVKSIALSSTTLSMEAGSTGSLSASVSPSNATDKTVTWASSNESVAKVDDGGSVKAVAKGTATITATANDGSGVKATCTVTVTKTETGTANGHTWVDLDLPSGTKWATMNIGASTAEAYGDYFAWGETSGYNGGKKNFTLDTYTIDGENGFKKYSKTDGKTELSTADDAAYVNWGSSWRMPSKEQIDELLNSDYTKISTETVDGKNVKKITSKSNGQSIMIPLAGYRREYELYEASYQGYFWSRTLSSSDTDNAWQYFFAGSWDYVQGFDRRFGCSIRPVLK